MKGDTITRNGETYDVYLASVNTTVQILQSHAVRYGQKYHIPLAQALLDLAESRYYSL